MEIHQAAEIFPLMTDEEYRGLVEDIREHGLREPLVTFEGKLLDGRNRLRACEEIGIKPEFIEWPNGESPYDYVISKNMHRRHLTEGQKGMIMAELPFLKVGENQYTKEGGSQDPPSISNDEAAAIAGVSTPTIKRAKAVFNYGTPEDISAVKGGAPLAPIARRVIPKRAKTPQAKPKKGEGSGPAVTCPGGMTLEGLCRKGLEHEATGLSAEAVAKDFHISASNYRMMRDIVLLSDRDDLSDADAKTVSRALEQMNESGRVVGPHQIISDIAKRVWGHRGIRTEKTETRRLEDFERAFGHIVQASTSSDQIEIPYLSEDRARRAVEDLNEGIRHMRNLKAKLEELYGNR